MIVHKLVLNQNHKMSCHIKVSFMFFVVCILFQAKAKDPDARPRPHTMLLYYLLLCSYSYISGPFSMRWALVLTAQDSQPDNMKEILLLKRRINLGKY